MRWGKVVDGYGQARRAGSIHHPKLPRCNPHPLLEKTAEMLRVLKPKFIRHFAHRLAGVEDPLLGHFNQFRLDVFLRRFARFFFDEVTKIIGDNNNKS